MLWLILALTFFTVSLLSLSVLQAFANRGRPVRERLRQIKKMKLSNDVTGELHRPFLERMVKPAFAGLGNSLGNLAPREIRGRLDQRLVHAANPWNLTAHSFIAVQALLGALFLGGGAALVSLSQAGGPRAFIVVLFCGMMGVMLPLMLLNARVAGRQKQILKSLPDVLDLLLVSVEAGLSFDMALKRVAEQMPGELSSEIGRTLEEIRMGKTREAALRSMVRRTGVHDMGTFVSAVIQAEQLGSNIANTLRIQAGTMRGKRRQRAEEAAMKAPIKMLFPLIFFIFPALFVVLLGPALIRLFDTFKSLL